jgi:predicted ester cyclase
VGLAADGGGELHQVGGQKTRAGGRHVPVASAARAISRRARVAARAPLAERARRPSRALFEAITAGDLDRIDDLVSADFVDHGAPPGVVGPGPEGYRTVMRMLRGALDLRWELLGMVAEGERVMVRVRNHGRHVGEFLGIPPTGAEFAFEAMHSYRVEDGVIREHFAVRDDLTMLRALGVVPG